MMKHSPYLDQVRDLDVLLRLVREYDAQAKTPRHSALPVRSAGLMRAGNHMPVAGPARVVHGKSSLKRAS